MICLVCSQTSRAQRLFARPSDVNGDGEVNVNDLLQMLGVFNGDCSPAAESPPNVAGGSDGTEEVECCGGGAACGFAHCPALGAGQDGCVQPWAMPNGMDFDTDCAAPSRIGIRPIPEPALPVEGRGGARRPRSCSAA
jgi:hypothetical protein